MFVIVWEPKHGRGGGHQAVLDKAKAEKLCQKLAWEKPENVYRVEPAEAYASAAVTEHQRYMHRRLSIGHDPPDGHTRIYSLRCSMTALA